MIIEQFTQETVNGITDYVSIINDDINTIMLKSVWDELNADSAGNK